MSKDKTIKVNTGDWNDLLKASAKKGPAFIKVKIKDIKPLPAVVVKTQNVVTIEIKGIRKEDSRIATSWVAVENAKFSMKEPDSVEVEVAYASTFEEAKQWARKLNG